MFDFPVVITEPSPALESAEDIAALYERQLMTPQMLAALRRDAARLGIKRVFIVKSIGYVHLGKLSFPAFREVVGRDPVDDDLHRVNCLDGGKVGHYLCGWCGEHETPRFQCACLLS